jgi:Fe-S-cluster containining protein
VLCPAECCKFEGLEDMPVVLEDEIDVLTREAGRIGARLQFVPAGEYNGVRLYRWIIRGACPFNRNGRCTIHEIKPLACKIFPLAVNLKTGDVYLSEKCLWVRLNGPRPLDEFPAEREALKRLLVRLGALR